MDPVTALKILVVDDHEVVRLGIRSLIADEPHWTVCGEAEDGQSAVDKALNLSPDVVVMDVLMPGVDGIEATRRIVDRRLGGRVLVHSVKDSEASVREALRAGARGYVLKSDLGRDLLDGIRNVSQGRPFFSVSVADAVIAGYLRERDGDEASRAAGNVELSPRECEVLLLLVQGHQNRQIAISMGITTKTVESHRRNLMGKLGFHSVTELVRYAIRQGWIEA